MLTVGDKFPDFLLHAVKAGAAGLDKAGPFETISREGASDKWMLIFFWPKDFTFVCPTEIAAFGKLSGEFADRDTVTYGVSVDNEFVHMNWRLMHPELKDLTIPMLSDLRRELSSACGILDRAEGVALRATFLVDPAGIIRFVSVNDMSVGRNPNEVLRVLDALQSDELCACNWTAGEAHIDPVAA